MSEFFSNISITVILQYYAVFCLVFSPVSVFILIVLYKKTNLIDKLDKAIDRLLGIKDDNKKKDAGKDSQKQDNKKEQDIADKPELAGIATFKIKIGELYYCRQSTQSRNNGIYDLVWNSENEFIGMVDKNAVFHALKAGTVNIFYARKDDAFDIGSQAYRITVVPTNPEWWIQKLIDDVSKRRPRAEILTKNIEMKIEKNIPETGILRYARTKGRDKGITYQFDSGDKLERIVIRLTDGAKAINGITRELYERFDELELKNAGGIRIWIHKVTDQEHDEVDLYCFIKGDILAIGQTWREYGTVEEFTENIRMAEQVFVDCLPGNIPGGYEINKEAFEAKYGIREEKKVNNDNQRNVPDTPPEEKKKMPDETEATKDEVRTIDIDEVPEPDDSSQTENGMQEEAQPEEGTGTENEGNYDINEINEVDFDTSDEYDKHSDYMDEN